LSGAKKKGGGTWVPVFAGGEDWLGGGGTQKIFQYTKEVPGALRLAFRGKGLEKLVGSKGREPGGGREFHKRR